MGKRVHSVRESPAPVAGLARKNAGMDKEPHKNLYDAIMECRRGGKTMQGTKRFLDKTSMSDIKQYLVIANKEKLRLEATRKALRHVVSNRRRGGKIFTGVNDSQSSQERSSMDEENYAFWNPSGFGPTTDQDFVIEAPTKPYPQPGWDSNKGKSTNLEKVRKVNMDNWRSFRTNRLANASNTEGYNFKLGRFGKTGNGFGKINQEVLGWKKGMELTGFGKWNTGLVLEDECIQMLEFPNEDFRLRCATEANSKDFVRR
jgi:hypothetical protein